MGRLWTAMSPLPLSDIRNAFAWQCGGVTSHHMQDPRPKPNPDDVTAWECEMCGNRDVWNTTPPAQP